MKQQVLWKLGAIVWVTLWGLASPARAQPAFSAWRFGIQAGLQFSQAPVASLPVPVNTNPITGAEACAALADSAGVLQCYANGIAVYDRLGQAMPNGQLSGTSLSAVQGALLLPDPGGTRLVYLFTVDATENKLLGGLRYSVIDMTRRGGLGDVLTPNSLALTLAPPNNRCTEALTAVRHANMSDYWVVVHGINSADFFAYQLTAAGVVAGPQRSTAGSVHVEGVSSAVALRASPDGRTLAAGVSGAGVELFDFDDASGLVSNPRRLVAPAAPYGLEFSADNTKLYVTNQQALYQHDLTSALPPVVLAQNMSLYGLQRGPDSRLYVAGSGHQALGLIAEPNRAGPACDYQPAAVPLGSGHSLLGLPNFPNALGLRAVRLIGPQVLCLGQSAQFQGQGGPAGASYTWDFGEPASATNGAAGPLVQHQYAQPGKYTVRLQAGSVSGTQAVVVEAPAALRLARADTLPCDLAQPVLRLTGYLPGSTFVWSDGGPALPERVGLGPGQYTVQATSAAGCVATLSAVVPPACRVLIPTIITPNGDALNQTFVLKGLNAPDWNVRFYNRWGREVYAQDHYDNGWAALGQPAGVYYYLLRNPKTGQQLKGWVEVVR